MLLNLLAPELRAQLLEEAKQQLLSEASISLSPDKKATARQQQDTRVRHWMNTQYAKAFQLTIQERAAEIAELQKQEPGWLPTPPQV